MFALENLNLAQLAALYNSVADKPVNKFKDKPTGVARIRAQMAEKSLALVFNEEGVAALVADKPTEPTLDEVVVAASDPAADMPLPDFSEKQADAVRQAAVTQQQVQDTPASAPVVRRTRGPAPQHADEDILTVNTPNKKRVGSASHARFALYQDGMTVGDYLDACVALQGGKREKYRADIRWDHNHGFVGSYTPRQWANSLAGRDIEDDGQPSGQEG